MSDRWQKALEAQFEIWRWWGTPVGHQYAVNFYNRIAKKTPALAPLVKNLDDLERLKLLAADPIYISDEMLMIAEAAMETFEPEPLQQTDLISPAGFVYLPHPVITLDRFGKRTTVRAFAWYPANHHGDEGQTGIHLSLYSHFDDAPLDDYWKDETESVIADTRRRTGAWSLLHGVPWMFNDEVPGEESMEGRAGRSYWIAVQALLRLSMQYISVREQRQPDRAERRRMKRLEVPDRYVTVITLRRPRGERTGEERDVDWRHRWIVSGHWRKQWFSSISMHRQIWISPYVKGPEDKPLAIRKVRAFEVVR